MQGWWESGQSFDSVSNSAITQSTFVCELSICSFEKGSAHTQARGATEQRVFKQTNSRRARHYGVGGDAHVVMETRSFSGHEKELSIDSSTTKGDNLCVLVCVLV